MKRKTSSRHRTHEAREQSVWTRLPVRQISVVATVVVLIGAVLFLKVRQSPGNAAEPVAADATMPPEEVIPTASESSGSNSEGWATADAADTGTSSATDDLAPEAQLDQLLNAGEPVFLFFHSNTCAQCVRMTEIVEEVYPDYSDSVALVDVDVYDDGNRNLLQLANIRAIPTLIFVDREGEVEGHVGVLEADALRQQLANMAEE